MSFLKSKTVQYSLLILALLVFLTYVNVLNADFVSDDIFAIVNSPQIANFGNIFISPISILRNFLLFVSAHVGYQTPFFYRIFNILFHLGTAYCMYILLAILSKNKKYALAASALFAVHPLLTESVTWISAVTYPQYSFFLMSSLIAYVLAKQNKKYYYLSIGLFVFAVLSSEKAIVLPVILVLLEISFYNIREEWKKIIPYVVISGLIGIILVSGIGARSASLQTNFITQRQYYNPLQQIPIAVSYYLQLTALSVGLTLYHSELAMGPLQFILRVGILLALLLAIAISYKKSKFIFFWLSFFLIAISPTLIPLNIVWIVAERYAYLGTMGIIAASVYLLFHLLRDKKYEQFLYLIMILAVLTAMGISFMRNFDWQNQDNLWIATGKTSPSSPNTHNNLGDVYGRHGDLARSIAEFKRAIEIKPDYADAYHNLGSAYVNAGKIDEAIKSYQSALKYNPGLWQSHQNLGAIYFNQGKYKDAVEEFNQAIGIVPNNPNLYEALGIIYTKSGDKEKAKEAFSTALQFDPNNQRIQSEMSELEK